MAKDKLTTVERSWIMYDWANSAYATIMLAAVFPIFFTGICDSQNVPGDFWWGIGTSISTFTVAILAPVVGALSDFKGYKKKLFTLFLTLGIVFTAWSGFVGNWQLLIAGYIISHIGFSGSCLVNDAFLTDVTTPDRMDRVSSLGFGMGYIGGSTIPFLMSILLITFGPNFGIETTLAVRISVLIAAVWWGVFSIPFMKNVRQKYGIDKPESGFLKQAFINVGHTAKRIVKNKGMLLFLIAFFFYIDGVGTVISMATSYGTTLGLNSVMMIVALMVTQLVAFPCAILFGRLSGKHGSLNMITVAVGVYMVICILGFIMGFGLEEGFLTNAQATTIFWGLSVLVGMVQGGIQAISRSYFGKLVPPENAGEYFGFFDIFGKFAAVIGPMLYATTKGLTGRSSFSILSIILLFTAALIILLLGRKHMAK